MAIEKIHINNYKSLVDLTIEKPNPFSVFVGPNASGKSNIFEALDFYSYLSRIDIKQLVSSFGGIDAIFNLRGNSLEIELNFKTIPTKLIIPNRDGITLKIEGISTPRGFENDHDSLRFHNGFTKGSSYEQFFYEFYRIFINKSEKDQFPRKDDKRLSLDGRNLEKVLKRVLSNSKIRNEFTELLAYLIPDFKSIKISSDKLSGSDNLLIYEKHSKKPFSKQLISEGTFNIIALLTAILQSDDPQFICIEEPENGIHPEAIIELVSFFREQCAEKGHYIWLTTHSQTLVSELKPDEIIVVDKIKGETKVKQFQGKIFYDLKMDEAWLSNALSGGLI